MKEEIKGHNHERDRTHVTSRAAERRMARRDNYREYDLDELHRVFVRSVLS